MIESSKLYLTKLIQCLGVFPNVSVLMASGVARPSSQFHPFVSSNEMNLRARSEAALVACSIDILRMVLALFIG